MTFWTQEQAINEGVRRCRIGKVTQKHVPRPDLVIPMWPGPERNWWDDPFRPTWSPMFGSANRKCSCPPGAACGNVACPHLPIVTSNMMAAH